MLASLGSTRFANDSTGSSVQTRKARVTWILHGNEVRLDEPPRELLTSGQVRNVRQIVRPQQKKCFTHGLVNARSVRVLVDPTVPHPFAVIHDVTAYPVQKTLSIVQSGPLIIQRGSCQHFRRSKDQARSQGLPGSNHLLKRSGPPEGIATAPRPLHL